MKWQNLALLLEIMILMAIFYKLDKYLEMHNLQKIYFEKKAVNFIAVFDPLFACIRKLPSSTGK